MTTSGGVATRGGLAASGEYRWVYLWSWPIRAMHWIAALSIVTLAVTGFFIGRPYFMAGGEAGSPYVMGTVRFVHYVAAALLVMTGIVRIYWLFAGNKFERWRALFPVTRTDIRNLFRQIRHYALLDKQGQEPHYLGHNPLQQMSYTGMYVLALVEVITGFALYVQATPQSWGFQLMGWVIPGLGGLQTVRFIHHVTTWLFLAFIPMHVYFATRADVMEREGSISSIISGGKFVSAEHHYEDE
jgi:Ni/Fe-hydrogenase 1 B-type cytochrome subunit